MQARHHSLHHLAPLAGPRRPRLAAPLQQVSRTLFKPFPALSGNHGRPRACTAPSLVWNRRLCSHLSSSTLPCRAHRPACYQGGARPQQQQAGDLEQRLPLQQLGRRQLHQGRRHLGVRACAGSRCRCLRSSDLQPCHAIPEPSIHSAAYAALLLAKASQAP